jgi:hypothetical protein
MVNPLKTASLVMAADHNFDPAGSSEMKELVRVPMPEPISTRNWHPGRMYFGGE